MGENHEQISGLTNRNHIRFNAREDELNELYAMMDYFGFMWRIYQEYDALRALNLAFKLTILLILSVLLFFGTFSLIVLAVVYDGNEKYILFAGLCLAGAVILLILYFQTKKKHRLWVQSILMRIEELREKLAQNCIAYGPIVIGYEYTNPQILFAIQEGILTGKADTIQESLNLLTGSYLSGERRKGSPYEDLLRKKMRLQPDVTGAVSSVVIVFYPGDYFAKES